MFKVVRWGYSFLDQLSLYLILFYSTLLTLYLYYQGVVFVPEEGQEKPPEHRCHEENIFFYSFALSQGIVFATLNNTAPEINRKTLEVC